MLRNLKHYSWAQRHGHRSIGGLGEKRGREKGRPFFKGRQRAIANQTNIGTVSKAAYVRDTSERRDETHNMRISQLIDIFLNMSELFSERARVCVRVCVRVCACVLVCVRACVRVCVRE